MGTGGAARLSARPDEVPEHQQKRVLSESIMMPASTVPRNKIHNKVKPVVNVAAADESADAQAKDGLDVASKYMRQPSTNLRESQH